MASFNAVLLTAALLGASALEFQKHLAMVVGDDCSTCSNGTDRIEGCFYEGECFQVDRQDCTGIENATYCEAGVENPPNGSDSPSNGSTPLAPVQRKPIDHYPHSGHRDGPIPHAEVCGECSGCIYGGDCFRVNHDACKEHDGIWCEPVALEKKRRQEEAEEIARREREAAEAVDPFAPEDDGTVYDCSTCEGGCIHNGTCYDTTAEGLPVTEKECRSYDKVFGSGSRWCDQTCKSCPGACVFSGKCFEINQLNCSSYEGEWCPSVAQELSNETNGTNATGNETQSNAVGARPAVLLLALLGLTRLV